MTDSTIEADDDYDEDAEILIGLIEELATDAPNDDRFAMLDAIAFQVERSVIGPESSRNFARDLADPELRKRMMEHPAAAHLLGFFLLVLHRYNCTNGQNPEVKSTTAEKRAIWAQACFLKGKQGERWMPMSHRLGLSLRYQSELLVGLNAAGLTAENCSPSVWRKLNAKALRETYRLLHGQEYVEDNDTHRSQMAALRKLVTEIDALAILRMG